MFHYENNRARAVLCATVALFSMLAACSGGGGGSSTPSVPQSTPGPTSQGTSITIPLSQSGSIALPSADGISNTIAISPNNAPTGAQLTVGVSNSAPQGTHAVPVTGATTFEYLSLSASAGVTFKGFPKISLTLRSATKNQGQFYAWMYDVAAATWTDLGSITLSGSTLSFGGGSGTVTLKQGVTYVVVPFTAQPGATCPTPFKIFIANRPPANTVTVYDEAGNQITTPGTFPGIFNPFGVAFDSNRHQLYVANAGNSTVTVYDQPGNQIAAPGGFPGLAEPQGITFDAHNNRIYVTNINGTTVRDFITVYDEDGNPISTTGAFPDLAMPLGIAFDSHNNRLYVANARNCVKVYDEDGNPVTTAGSFCGGAEPSGITFDGLERRLYVANPGTAAPGITVFDEDGNKVTTSGTFPNTAEPFGITFDSNNRALYVTNVMTGSVTVYDEEGHQLTTTGTFPNLVSPLGIAAGS